MAAVSNENTIQCMLCHDDHNDINEDPNVDARWVALSACQHSIHQSCLNGIFDYNRRNNQPNICPTCREPYSRQDYQSIEEGVKKFKEAETEGRLDAFLRGRSAHLAAWDWRSGIDSGASLPARMQGSSLRRRVHAEIANFFDGLFARISLVVNTLILVSVTPINLTAYWSYKVVTGVHAFVVDRAEECFISIFEKIELVARLAFGAFYAVTTQLPIAIAYLTITVVDGFFDVLDCCGEECCF